MSSSLHTAETPSRNHNSNGVDEDFGRSEPLRTFYNLQDHGYDTTESSESEEDPLHAVEMQRKAMEQHRQLAKTISARDGAQNCDTSAAIAPLNRSRSTLSLKSIYDDEDVKTLGQACELAKHVELADRSQSLLCQGCRQELDLSRCSSSSNGSLECNRCGHRQIMQVDEAQAQAFTVKPRELSKEEMLQEQKTLIESLKSRFSEYFIRLQSVSPQTEAEQQRGAKRRFEQRTGEPERNTALVRKSSNHVDIAQSRRRSCSTDPVLSAEPNTTAWHPFRNPITVFNDDEGIITPAPSTRNHSNQTGVTSLPRLSSPEQEEDPHPTSLMPAAGEEDFQMDGFIQAIQKHSTLPAPKPSIDKRRPNSDTLLKVEVYRASLVGIASMVNFSEKHFDAFRLIGGGPNHIFVEWDPSGIRIRYKQAHTQVVWDVEVGTLRPRFCHCRRRMESNNFELVLGVHRPPDIYLLGPCKGKLAERGHTSIFVSGKLPELSSQDEAELKKEFVRHREISYYAIGDNSKQAEITGFQSMDSIILRFDGASEVMEKCGLVKFLTARGYMALNPSYFKLFRVDTDMSFETQGWDALSFPVRWKLSALISDSWATVKAIGPAFLRLLVEAHDDLASQALDFISDYLNQESQKLCEDNACTILEFVLQLCRSKRGGPRPELRSHCLWVAHVEVTPTKINCRGPYVEVSNRMLRQYHQNAEDFIRVSFVSENSGSFRAQSGYAVDRIKHILENGIDVFGRKFDFLMYSQSQLRTNSCWFLANDSDISVDEVRAWMGDASNNKSAGKYAARLGLSLSATRPSLPLRRNEYKLLDDIMSQDGRYIMTEGCGEISIEFAAEVAQKLNLKSIPSAFQIRYAGFKGMLVVSRRMPPGIKVKFRKSMQKMESRAELLEICEYSKFRYCYTNRQVLLLQSALGVPDQVILERQRRYVDSMTKIHRDTETAVEFLSSGGLGADREWEHNLLNLLTQGFDINEPFVQGTLQDMVRYGLTQVRRKARIRVDQGALLFGVCDPTGLLEPGQVIVQVNLPNGLLKSRLINVLGKVMVTRNPCLHPGDVRVFDAIQPPTQLAHLQDVIVFPVRGARPHASEMALGDMDGDFYSVYWDPCLIPPKQYPPFVYQPKQGRQTEGQVTVPDLKSFLVEHLTNNDVGLISNAHLVMADRNGVDSPECVQLVELANDAINYAKSGYRPTLPSHLRIKAYPDFLEKPAGFASYESKSILGKSFRDVKDVYNEFDRPLVRLSPRSGDVDPLLQYNEMTERERTDSISSAAEIKRQYDRELIVIMNQFHLRSETQLFSGAYRTFEEVPGKDKINAGAAHRNALTFKQGYRDKFYKDIRSTYRQNGTEYQRQCLIKVSAWYYVAYSNSFRSASSEDAFPAQSPMLRSFPWVVADELIKLRYHNLKHSNR